MSDEISIAGSASVKQRFSLSDYKSKRGSVYTSPESKGNKTILFEGKTELENLEILLGSTRNQIAIAHNNERPKTPGYSNSADLEGDWGFSSSQKSENIQQKDHFNQTNSDPWEVKFDLDQTWPTTQSKTPETPKNDFNDIKESDRNSKSENNKSEHRDNRFKDNRHKSSRSSRNRSRSRSLNRSNNKHRDSRNRNSTRSRHKDRNQNTNRNRSPSNDFNHKPHKSVKNDSTSKNNTNNEKRNGREKNRNHDSERLKTSTEKTHSFLDRNRRKSNHIDNNNSSNLKNSKSSDNTSPTTKSNDESRRPHKSNNNDSIKNNTRSNNTRPDNKSLSPIRNHLSDNDTQSKENRTTKRRDNSREKRSDTYKETSKSSRKRSPGSLSTNQNEKSLSVRAVFPYHDGGIIIGARGSHLTKLRRAVPDVEWQISGNTVEHDDRLLVVKGTPEDISEAFCELSRHFISQNAYTNIPEFSKSSKNNKDIDSSEPFIAIRFLLPHRTCGSVIGHNNDILNSIRAKSRAYRLKVYHKFFFDSRERIVEVVGTPNSVRKVTLSICRQVEEFLSGDQHSSLLYKPHPVVLRTAEPLKSECKNGIDLEAAPQHIKESDNNKYYEIQSSKAVSENEPWPSE
ncbi:hypothetical protein BB558_001561 [Smittium angustum]|uniref:K Homology domain-containing protein n=1 Tax=Smittium angustum TaxID=133377 RepID=A0A2U1JBG2_SMIAN|nr:hypothetical protein BB558_001561 [Smittium angustum]